MSKLVKTLDSNEAPRPAIDHFLFVADSRSDLLAQEAFIRMLYLEQKRTERSRRRFVLMLLESASLLRPWNHGGVLDKILSALSDSTRETDIKGWYKDGVIGIVFTEIGSAEGSAVAHALLAKVTNALSGALNIEQLHELKLSFHVFPEMSDENGPGSPFDPALYPDVAQNGKAKKTLLQIKRLTDIAGSLLLLILLSPILFAIAVLVQLTSRGPILFRQDRIGRYGKRFTFYKFRSMRVNNDHGIHKEYVKRLISGTPATDHPAAPQPNIYKLTKDPRVTPLGRFLRRTSLDELPQLFNVLTGSMSLVGPRPPLPYEFDCYDTWHKRRLLATPGITGLWQVRGRSRVTFADMVRLDLRYARTWSFWLDVIILLRTPRAVIRGEGAY